MRIVFAGTPQLAAEQLMALCDTPHDVVAVYTQPDRPKGRGLKDVQSPVKAYAQKKNIPVHQPTSLKTSEALNTLAAYQPDVIIVAAYGLLLPTSILELPPLGCINIHFSLLPKWRGAAPIQYAILSGDPQTGITLMKMDEGLDTGNIVLQETCDILPSDTSTTLANKLSQTAQTLLKEKFTVSLLQQDTIPQDTSRASYAPKIQKEQAKIDFSKQNAKDIERMIRAFDPWPRPFFILNNQKILVHEAMLPTTRFDTVDPHPGQILQADDTGVTFACQHGVICLKTLQFPGKKAMPFREILKSKRDLFQVKPIQ